MNNDRVDVYIEGGAENLVPDLALKADHILEERWNGWLRPIATADAFGSFLDAWRLNDPNGIWGYVTEVGDTLVCSVIDSDEPADEFPRVGETADGAALYDLTGRVWVAADHYDAG